MAQHLDLRCVLLCTQPKHASNLTGQVQTEPHVIVVGVSGQKLHAKPRVREVLMCCELLFGAWTNIREDVLPVLRKLMTEQQSARFDVTLFIYFFEVRLPLALLTYLCFLRNSVKGPTPREDGQGPDGNKQEWGYLWCLAHLAVGAFTTQRKNYTNAFLEYHDRMQYWRRTDHALGSHMEIGQLFCNEDKGESYVHACLREIDFWGSSQASRDAGLAMFARRQGLNPQAAAFEGAFRPPRRTKLRNLCETNLQEGREVGIAMLLSLVESMVSATPADMPTETAAPSRTTFHTSLWHCPTITGNNNSSIGMSLMAFTNA
jgi:hypothetical protein